MGIENSGTFLRGMAEMKFNVESELLYRVHEPSTFVMNVAVIDFQNQRIHSDKFSLAPNFTVEAYNDTTLNNHTYRFVADPGSLTVRYQAEVSVDYELEEPSSLSPTRPENIPLNLVPYITPSRYCQSDQLQHLGNKEFGRLPQGYAQVQSICDWINRNVDYIGQTTDEHTSAMDTLVERRGVCRDFAHLGVAFCRTLNIPARFVSGYAYDLEPPDFHAMFEAWLDGNWYLFDPTQRVPRTGFIRIGTGRDAADVPFANIIGAADFDDFSIDCSLHATNDGSIEQPRSTDKAVRIGTA
jgi:transglutaminase-like putative cysteine protease